MTMQEQDWHGWAFHVHHANQSPIEYCTSYQERREAILNTKPATEHTLRLARLRRVTSTIPPAYVKAWDAYVKARDAYVRARDAYDKAGAAYAKARDAYAKARDAYAKAGDAYDKAWATYDKAWATALLALIATHERECTPTGCLWTPQHPSIFPGEVQP